jgi:predicted  nucleic acid-binding Zn-ribbon protein
MGLLAAGTLVSDIRAQPQSSDQTSAQTGASAAANAKQKKVWTNDDVSEIQGGVSVVGTPQQKPARRASPMSSLQPASGARAGANKSADAKSETGIDPKILAQLRQQLQKLQTSIDLLDKQIEQLKGASRGDSKNLGGLNADTRSYSTASMPDQIKSLEGKRSALQAAMDNLLDAARESGIEPGQLR